MEKIKKNKKIIIFVLLIIVIVIVLGLIFFNGTKHSNKTNTNEVNKPIFKSSRVSVGEVIELDNYSSYKNIKWVSSNTDVATVDNGVVSGLNSGTTTILVYENDKVIAKYEVDVYDNEEPQIIEPESINLDQVDITLVINESKTIVAIILPNDAEEKTIVWSSSNDDVVSVSNGQITGKKVGNATITATAINGIKTSANVKVIEAPTKVIEVSNVSLSAQNTSFKVGDTIDINVKISPSDATDKTIIWSSDDTNIAVVSDGKVTGVNAGTAIISAISSNGKKASITITVNAIEPNSISLNKRELNLKIGETSSLTPIVLPSNAGDKTVTWTSSDDSIAFVDSGVVMAKKEGTATIVATTKNGLNASCFVTVQSVPVVGISLNKTSDTINVGKTYQLTITILPTDATDKTITWTSSNTAVATVSNNGLVTAIKDGTATITATSSNGLSATFTATVITPVTDVSLNYSNVYMLQENANESKVTYKRSLVATVTPSNATNKELTWTSSNPSVAIVDSDGVVSAKKEGTTVITVTTKDGNKTASATVRVEPNILTNIYDISPSLVCALTRNLGNNIRAMQGVNFYKDGSTTYALYAGFQADDKPTVMTLVNLNTCSVVTKNNEQVFGHANDITYSNGKFYVTDSSKTHGLTVINNDTIILDENPINMNFAFSGVEYDNINKKFYSKSGNYLYTFPSLTSPKSSNKWIGIVPNYYSNIDNGQITIVNQGLAYSNGNIYLPRTISNSSSTYYNHSFIMVYDASTGIYKYTMHFSGDFLCHLEGMTVIGDSMYLGMNCHQASPKNQTFLVFNGLSAVEQRYHNS